MTARGATALFVLTMLAGSIVGILVPAGLGWDFANFYDAGRRVAAGQADDLYRPAEPIAGLAPQGTTGFFGAPISAWLYAPLAKLSPDAALRMFKIQDVAAFCVTFLLLFHFHRRFQPAGGEASWEFAAIFSGLCLAFQPFWTIFRVGGQTTPFALLCLTLGMIAHTEGRWWGSAIWMVIAALIKPAVAPIVLFLMCVSGLSFFWRAGATLVVAGLVSLIGVGWPVHAEFLALMRESGQGTWAWFYNSSLTIVVDNIHSGMTGRMPAGPDARFAGLIVVLQIAMIGLVAYFTWRGHQQDWSAPARRHFDFMMAVLLFLFWSKTLWEHYLALLFLPLIYIVATRSWFSPRALRIVAAIFILCVFQNLIFTSWLRATFAFSSVPALLAVALFKSGPLLLMLVLLVRHHREWFRSYSAWPVTE